MRKIWIVVAIAVALLAAFLAHRHFNDLGRLTSAAVYTGLERQVSDNRITSLREPAATLTFGPEFSYLGGQKFVLYGMADTEQHLFIETDADNRLTSVYWVQFEEYLPSNDYIYNYEASPLRMNIGGYDFYVDTAAVKPDPKNRRRGSDGARVREFLQSKGYVYPDTFAYARLVHLTDESRRKELMIIFIDEAPLGGLDPDDLQEGGAVADRWPAIEQAHLDRIRRTLSLAATDNPATSTSD